MTVSYTADEEGYGRLPAALAAFKAVLPEGNGIRYPYEFKPELKNEGFRTASQVNYVACCGTSIQPVLQMLEQAPQLDTVLLCLDNDETGHQASRRMREQLEMRYSVERLIPESKDWNDDLTLSIENAQGFAMNEMR